VKRFRLGQTTTFDDDLARLGKAGGDQILDRADGTMRKLLLDPYHAANSHRLRGRHWVGCRTVDIPQVGRGKWRIVFAICEECMKLGKELSGRFDCPECPEICEDATGVILIAIVDTHIG
jgi:hypothetical protein